MTTPTPFFVSIASKELRLDVNPLETTLVRPPGSVHSKDSYSAAKPRVGPLSATALKVSAGRNFCAKMRLEAQSRGEESGATRLGKQVRERGRRKPEGAAQI